MQSLNKYSWRFWFIAVALIWARFLSFYGTLKRLPCIKEDLMCALYQWILRVVNEISSSVITKTHYRKKFPFKEDLD